MALTALTHDVGESRKGRCRLARFLSASRGVHSSVELLRGIPSHVTRGVLTPRVAILGIDDCVVRLAQEAVSSRVARIVTGRLVRCSINPSMLHSYPFQALK